MPQVNEEEQTRQTYGNAPGWSERQSTEPAKLRLAPVAPPASPPGQDAEAAPSAEAVEETPPAAPSPEQAPPSPSQEDAAASPEVPFHQHPRWQEVQREKEALRQQNLILTQTLQRLSQAPPAAPPVPPAPQADPWEGLINHPDAETARFYQQQKRLMEHAVQQGREQAFQELKPVLDTISRTTASISLKDFRRENPDIQPGSEEEGLVLAYMEGRVDGIRHPIESARNNAVIKRMETELKALKARQAATPQKRQAAQVERGSGIPQASGLPAAPVSAVERAREVVRKGGSYVDVARAFFGTGGRKPQVE